MERCAGSPTVATEPVITQQGIVVRVSGTAAGSCGEFSLYRLALSQMDNADALFRLLWKELGGTFSGKVRPGMAPLDAVTLVTHESPTLSEAIRQINKHSNNVMARTLLLTLGAERGRKPADPVNTMAGVDGTVRRRLKNEATQGMAHLKTGTLRDVRAIAGYVLGASGKRYVVVSIVNHEQAHVAKEFDDALIEWLAKR